MCEACGCGGMGEGGVVGCDIVLEGWGKEVWEGGGCGCVLVSWMGWADGREDGSDVRE